MGYSSQVSLIAIDTSPGSFHEDQAVDAGYRSR